MKGKIPNNFLPAAPLIRAAALCAEPHAAPFFERAQLLKIFHSQIRGDGGLQATLTIGHISLRELELEVTCPYTLL